MYSACGNAALPALGFPIRESADHRLFSAYPRLIAAVHALHRLLVPRHPPCALHILTVITHPAEAEHAVIPVTLEKLCSFQGSRTQRLRRGHKQESPAGLADRSLKTQQHARRRARVLVPSDYPGTEPPGTFRSGRRTRTWPFIGPRCAAPRRVRRSNPGDFPRKEVIQPHLPVRLPCYDFTPVTSPTFDGSLPKGLGHRLRVLLASVV